MNIKVFYLMIMTHFYELFDMLRIITSIRTWFFFFLPFTVSRHTEGSITITTTYPVLCDAVLHAIFRDYFRGIWLLSKMNAYVWFNHVPDIISLNWDTKIVFPWKSEMQQTNFESMEVHFFGFCALSSTRSYISFIIWNEY